jgi:hypothetical protein
VAEVERFLEEPPELPGMTREALHRAKLAWVRAEELSSEEWAAEWEAWREHLGRLRPGNADEATHELRKFRRVLTWVQAPEPEEAEAEA